MASRDGKERTRLACLACRKRRIKCPGQRPKCETCQSRNKECIYEDRLDQRKPYRKAFVTSLQARIVALEHELDRVQKGKGSQGRRSEIVPPKASIDQDVTQQPTSSSSVINNNDDDYAMELASDRAQVMRHADTALHEGTYRFFGPSSGRTFQAAHCRTPFRYKRIHELSRAALDRMGVSPDEYLNASSRSLYAAYFQHADPLLMVMQRDIFYQHLTLWQDQQYQTATQISDLLLTAICAVGAIFVEESNSEADSSSNSANQRCKRYMQRLQELIDIETRYPQLTTVQALTLCAYCEITLGFESRGWLYVGMAARIALELGLQRDSHEFIEKGWMSDADVRARHVSLWALYVFDHHMALVYGRPASLQLQDITTTPPSAMACSRSRKDCSSCGHFSEHAVAFYNLIELASHVLQDLYDERRGDSKEEVIIEEFSRRNMQLAQWRTDLPRTLLCTFTRQQVPTPATLYLHLVWHVVMILLNRPFLSPRRRSHNEQDGGGGGLVLRGQAWSACHTSSREISRLTSELLRHHGARRSHNFIVHILYAAATISLMNVRAENGKIKRQARNDLKMLYRSLQQMASIHKNVFGTLQILSALISRRFEDEPKVVQEIIHEGDLESNSNDTPSSSSDVDLNATSSATITTSNEDIDSILNGPLFFTDSLLGSQWDSLLVDSLWDNNTFLQHDDALYGYPPSLQAGSMTSASASAANAATAAAAAAMVDLAGDAFPYSPS